MGQRGNRGLPGTGGGSPLPGGARILKEEGVRASDQEIADVFKRESGRALASLVRRFGDIELAEEMVQEAFVEAVRRWPATGLPPSPAGWIITTARNRAIDRLRRESTRDQRQWQSTFLSVNEPDVIEPVEDDQLRLIFTCCHPAIAPDARVALTLKLIAGLQTSEIARAFLVSESAMAQRLTRAKRKIKAANIPYRIPPVSELPERLSSVLAVVYLIFNEGYLASSGGRLIREELSTEAIRLARLVAGLMPHEPEVTGLLALLLLTEARRPARLSEDGAMIRLANQDRSLWSRDLIDEGHELVRACLLRNQPGPYQIQAAIAAVHADATSSSLTDWHQIVTLYDQLLVLKPTPIVALNRAIAVAQTRGPEQALSLVEELDLPNYHLYHATRGELLERLGRTDDALAAFRTAFELAKNDLEKRYLRDRLDDLGA